jgi:DNA-binding MarR family transcriptional regulator
LVFRFERQLRHQTQGPFTATDLSVLGATLRYGPIPLSELAAREHLSLPTISKVASKLEKAGLVKRVLDAEDRRIVRVNITPAGERLIHDGRNRRNKWLADCMSSLDPDELDALQAAIPVLERMLGDDAWNTGR